MRIKGTFTAGHFAASTLSAQYDIILDASRNLKNRIAIDIDDESAARLVADGLAEQTAPDPIAVKSKTTGGI